MDVDDVEGVEGAEAVDKDTVGLVAAAAASAAADSAAHANMKSVGTCGATIFIFRLTTDWRNPHSEGTNERGAIAVAVDCEFDCEGESVSCG